MLDNLTTLLPYFGSMCVPGKGLQATPIRTPCEFLAIDGPWLDVDQTSEIQLLHPFGGLHLRFGEDGP